MADLQPETIRRVVQAAEIKYISLKEFQCKTDRPTHQLSASDFEADISVDAKWHLQDHQLIVETRFTLEGTTPEDAPPSVFFFAAYWVVYQLTSKDLEEDALDYFAKVNAPFNLYPYFRELTDTTAKRMGLPFQLLLPLLKQPTGNRN